jgi:hypothetical protein
VSHRTYILGACFLIAGIAWIWAIARLAPGAPSEDDQ